MAQVRGGWRPRRADACARCWSRALRIEDCLRHDIPKAVQPSSKPRSQAVRTTGSLTEGASLPVTIRSARPHRSLFRLTLESMPPECHVPNAVARAGPRDGSEHAAPGQGFLDPVHRVPEVAPLVLGSARLKHRLGFDRRLLQTRIPQQQRLFGERQRFRVVQNPVAEPLHEFTHARHELD